MEWKFLDPAISREDWPLIPGLQQVLRFDTVA